MVTPGDWLRGAFTPHKLKHNVIMLDAELDSKSNNDKVPNYWSEKAKRGTYRT
jgi:hypothetical protein